MTLIGYAHSSQFMEWQNLGIKTLKHAKCAPNVFKKLTKNWITTDVIYLTSSNFVAISHINYWDQINSWKNLWKFWNGLLCSPLPLLTVAGYWKSSNTEACVWETVSDTCKQHWSWGGGGIGLRIYVRYCRPLLSTELTIKDIWLDILGLKKRVNFPVTVCENTYKNTRFCYRLWLHSSN